MAAGTMKSKGPVAVLIGAVFVVCAVGTVAMARCSHEAEPPKATSQPVAPTTTVKADQPAEPEYTKVTLDGKTFKLELALDEQKRFKGLSDRTEIPAEGGMMFVFPQASRQYFVMRDCPIPIDIIFLDASGRITAFHKMTVESARSPEEGKPGETNMKYEERLKRYSSKYDAQYVIELKGNTLDGLKLKEGQQIKVDGGLQALKERCR